MGAYDLFSNFYDLSLERLYAPQRALAAEALRLRPGAVVLDVPCGTGQAFDALAKGVGADGAVLGVDVSAGMLKRAKARAERLDAPQIRLLEADATTLDQGAIDAALGGARAVTHLHVFLGMSVFPEMEKTFERLWSLLAPGGRCALVDVHTASLGLQGFMVNKMAGAEIRRRFWEPLERVASDYERRDLPANRQHGGQIMLATGMKR